MQLSSLVVMLMTSTAVTRAEGERTIVRPADTGAALGNPGMGWVLHFYDNVPANYGSRLAPADTVEDFPGLAVVYLRIPWSYLEPEEGRYNWAVVDTPAQRWVRRGKQVAFRFSCSESWMRYATPAWVERAGAKGLNFRPGAGVQADGPFWEPDFDDPVFFAKLDRFLAAAGERYDGHPEVAFVDVGSFGVWGEGHTYSSTQLPYSAETVRRHVGLYRRHFPRTLLAANDDFVYQDRGEGAIEYAREQGLTLRDDSILVQGGENAYFHAAMAQAFWPRLPVILESEHYGGSRDRGNWQDGSRYLQAVEEYHASYASIHWWPREFLEECRDLIGRINQRLGYRLQLVEASWPGEVRMGAAMAVQTAWRNAGVAPCYGGGFPALTLKEAAGGIAGVFVQEALDLRDLPVGPPGQAEERTARSTCELPFNLPPGAYGLYVSVGTRTGTPRLALPLAGDDGERRYRLGTLRVTGDYDAQVGQLERQGDAWLLPLTWTSSQALPAGVRPFCHFEAGGEIVFQGLPVEGALAERLAAPGTVEVGWVFAVPEGARGRSFEVKVGLWLPERLGQPEERLIPDRGEGDRRVVVGELSVAADGSVTFEESAPAP